MVSGHCTTLLERVIKMIKHTASTKIFFLKTPEVGISGIFCATSNGKNLEIVHFRYQYNMISPKEFECKGHWPTFMDGAGALFGTRQEIWWPFSCQWGPLWHYPNLLICQSGTMWMSVDLFLRFASTDNPKLHYNFWILTCFSVSFVSGIIIT